MNTNHSNHSNHRYDQVEGKPGSPSPEISRSGTFKKEGKKEVWSDKRHAGLVNFLLFHLPSIAVTISLFCLYLREVTWKPPGPGSEVLGILQFAAKAHEGLIVVSLSDILLHRVRWGLLGQEGVPLGFLSSAHHLPAPLLYLFSWEFWGTVVYPVNNKVSHFISVAAIIILTLIGIGAAPTSAVTMIPREVWQPVKIDTSSDEIASSLNLTHFGADLGTLYLNSSIYKMNLGSGEEDAPLGSGDCLSALALGEETGCFDVSPMMQSFWASITLLPGNTRSQTSIPVTRLGRWAPFRPIEYSSFEGFETQTAWATGPMYGISYVLSRAGAEVSAYPDRDFKIEAKIKDSEEERWKQPVVIVSCREPETEGSNNDSLAFKWTDDDAFGSFSLTLDLTEESLASFHGEDIKSHYATLDLQDRIDRPLSASMLLAGWQRIESGPTNNTLVYNLCLIQARWMEADIWVNTGQAVGAQTDLGIDKKDIPNHMRKTSSSENVIQMSSDWLDRIGAQNSTASEDSNATENQAYIQIYEGAMRFLSKAGSTSTVRATFLPEMLSIYFVDALTDLKGWSLWEDDAEKTDSNKAPAADDQVLDFAFSSHLYGYFLGGGFVLPLSMSILGIHVIIVLIHHCLLFFTPRPWFSSRWESWGELVTLAMRSRPPPESRMRNIGAGVGSAETWAMPIVVRDLDNQGRLEMVLKEDVASALGVGEDMEAHPLMGLVRPGVKYG
ncbi:unnamed protein product [Clonostachys byssicola]|uniref:Uncharacterized protein n=1 Tax=Clonostachys byssicola TaxID=160290 RepID=A0A9N9U7H4_9HYPO|nr:unnamed protein product [Clonostachys byssicola]